MALQADFMICTEELCRRISVTTVELRDIVAHGIIQPEDSAALEWQFAEQATRRAARAARLHRDLDIDWPGVALALELLGEVQSLRRENILLRRRLARFEQTPQ